MRTQLVESTEYPRRSSEQTDHCAVVFWQFFATLPMGWDAFAGSRVEEPERERGHSKRWCGMRGLQASDGELKEGRWQQNSELQPLESRIGA